MQRFDIKTIDNDVHFFRHVKPGLLLNVLSKRLSHLVKRSNQARFLVREGVEAVFSMVGTDTTGTDTPKWQFFHYIKKQIGSAPMIDSKFNNAPKFPVYVQRSKTQIKSNLKTAA